MKLTKAQKKTVLRAVKRELQNDVRLWFDDDGPAFVAEARRLLRIALAAVAKDGRR